jgi:DNA repair exonuclease SbcCD ATPase subunit
VRSAPAIFTKPKGCWGMEQSQAVVEGFEAIERKYKGWKPSVKTASEEEALNDLEQFIERANEQSIDGYRSGGPVVLAALEVGFTDLIRRLEEQEGSRTKWSAAMRRLSAQAESLAEAKVVVEAMAIQKHIFERKLSEAQTSFEDAIRAIELETEQALQVIEEREREDQEAANALLEEAVRQNKARVRVYELDLERDRSRLERAHSQELEELKKALAAQKSELSRKFEDDSRRLMELESLIEEKKAKCEELDTRMANEVPEVEESSFLENMGSFLEVEIENLKRDFEAESSAADVEAETLKAHIKKQEQKLADIQEETNRMIAHYNRMTYQAMGVTGNGGQA